MRQSRSQAGERVATGDRPAQSPFRTLLAKATGQTGGDATDATDTRSNRAPAPDAARTGPGTGPDDTARIGSRVDEVERLVRADGPLHRDEIGTRLRWASDPTELGQVLRVAGRERRVFHHNAGVYAVEPPQRPSTAGRGRQG
jgi:hypothetical protein